MYKPRKTIDLFDEEKNNQPQSSSRPSRKSRLQQPSRQNAGSRSMSNVRQSTAQNATESSSASKPTRPSRGVSATPLRTPQSRSRSMSGCRGTAEKDRRALPELAHQIQEKLFSHPSFSSELLPSGLKGITTKQFVATISFFMKSVVGNARGTRITNVTTDDIAQWLTMIQYPHMQSRSWLKTPNVPHAFGHVVELMQWLSNFIPDNPEDPMPSFRKSEYYINEYMSNAFCDVVQETFVLWNNDLEEDTQKSNQARLVNECIRQRIGVDSAKTVSKETDKIKAEIVNLNKERMVLSPNQLALLESQQAKHTQFKLDQKRLMDQLHDKNMNFQRLKSELKVNEKQKHQLEEQQGRLKATVRAQIMSKEEFNKMLEECAEKKSLIKAKQESIAHLKNIEYNKQLNYSRRLKQQTDSITKLNMFIHEMAEILQLSNYQNICVDTKQSVFSINDHLKLTLPTLEDCITTNQTLFVKLNADLSTLGNEMAKVSADVRVLQTDLAEMTKGCQAIKERRTQLQSTVGLTESEKMVCLKQMSRNIEELQRQTATLYADLKAKRATGREMCKDNARFLEESEHEIRTLVADKERRVDGICEAIAKLKQACADMLSKRDAFQIARQDRMCIEED